MIHKGFNREISIGKQQFRFTEGEFDYVVVILKTGYYLVQFQNNVEIKRHEKLSLDKLNLLMPDNFQLSKDHIIYVLTADEDAE